MEHTAMDKVCMNPEPLIRKRRRFGKPRLPKSSGLYTNRRDMTGIDSAIFSTTGTGKIPEIPANLSNDRIF